MSEINIIYDSKEHLTDQLLKLVSAIAIKGNCGHSFKIIVDPDDEPITINWDGDGCDRIWSITNGDGQLIAGESLSARLDGKSFKDLFE